MVFIAGCVLGLGLKGKSRFLSVIRRATDGAVYLLLFLLGLSVGSNRIIIANIGRLGLQALILTTGAVTGSVLLASLLNRWAFRRGSDEK